MTLQHLRGDSLAVTPQPAKSADLHGEIRRAVANLESARARYRRADAALDALLPSRGPHVDAASDRADRAEKALRDAWTALMDAMAAVGLRPGGVVVGGLVYVGDGVEWMDDALPQVVFPAEALLNLDAAEGGSR